jgi:hypothetical protein
MTLLSMPNKRRRRSQPEIEDIKSAIVDAVTEDPPMTVRQVFYQLVVRRVIEETEKEYNGTVIRLLSNMRLDGELEWGHIVDESRHPRLTETFDSLADAVESTARFYRRSALKDCDEYIEIWLEKDALAGVVWDVVSDYDVPLMVSRGTPSLTFLWGSFVQVHRAAAGKGTTIYQFGDHDPSGVLIPATINRRLNEWADKYRIQPPEIIRVALTEDQIAEHDLPTRPTKRTGNSHADRFDGDSVELDAIPAGVLRDLVRESVEIHIDPEQLKVQRVAEESERAHLRRMAALFNGGAA